MTSTATTMIAMEILRTKEMIVTGPIHDLIIPITTMTLMRTSTVDPRTMTKNSSLRISEHYRKSQTTRSDSAATLHMSL